MRVMLTLRSLRTRRLASFAAVVAAIASTAVAPLGCSSGAGVGAQDSSHDHPLPPGEGAALYVGAESDDFAGAIGTELTNVHATITIDGVVAHEETIDRAALPHAMKVTTTTAHADARVEVKLEGQIVNAGGPTRDAVTVAVTRLASTHFAPGQTRLLRLRLDARCATAAPLLLGGGPPALGPTCAAPETCIWGRCKDDAIAIDALEAYDDAWPSREPDLCRPAHGGAPEIEIGTGDRDFAALADGATVTPVRGPQGGYHIYVALKTKDLGQYGTKTRVDGAQVSTLLAAQGGAWATPYAPNDAGGCGLYGLRLVLENGPMSKPTLADFVGKAIDITVDVVDAFGAHVTATKRVQVAAP